MGFPLIPFAAGMAAGALAAVGSRDTGVRKHVVDGAQWLTATAEHAYGAVVSGVASLIGRKPTEAEAKPAKRARSKAAKAGTDAAKPAKRTRSKRAASPSTKRATARTRKAASA